MDYYIPLVLSLMFLAGCRNLTMKSDSTSRQIPSDRMQAMGESFATLLPIALDPGQFNAPANQQIIDDELTRLGQFAHADTRLEGMSKNFSSQMLEAKGQLGRGNREYARFVIRRASTACLSCHAQTDRGPHFLASPTNSYFTNLNSLDKASFLFAVWSFDNGLKEYEKAMANPEVNSRPFTNLESTTLHALAVAVRVKKEPALAEAIVTRIMYSKWAPVYLQMSAAKWKASIHEWKNGKNIARTLEDAKVLISKAWTKQMESPLARSGLIESLRASAILHGLLAQKRPGKVYAETLYYAGLNAEALRDLNPFLVHEDYFEACVRHYPHTETAKNCYLRLEGAQIADYGAFGSMPMPEKVKNDLSSLRKLAEPTEGHWLEWGIDG